MANPTLNGLLVRVSSPDGAALAAADLGAAAPVLETLGFGGLEPLFDVPGAADDGLGVAAAPPARWFRAPLVGSAGGPSPWDAVHAAAVDGLGLAVAGDVFIEPDLVQTFVTTEPRMSVDDDAALAARGRAGVADPQNPNFPIGSPFAWHLGEAFSELAAARASVGAGGASVRIAHLDTGYDAAHQTLPPRLRRDLQRNFVRGGHAGDAVDPGIDTLSPFDNPGHGAGTLSILAGGRVAPPGSGFDGFLGGAPNVDVIPIRVAESVVLIGTTALADALRHVASGGVGGTRLADVVSLSMGGVASALWADMVNLAYEAGVCIVAAAGNNFSTGLGGFPTRTIVYPARFRRVIAACGVMADRRPYVGLPVGTMQGNWGPDGKMATAMAAYTPNMPWAEHGAPTIVDHDGRGTSSATPQIAAAAALWLAEHGPAMDADARFALAPWRRVEAVRHALFTAAERTADGGRRDKLGNGILRARAALDVAPTAGLAMTPRDSAFLSLLDLVPGLGAGAPTASDRMLALEAAQLVQIAGGPDTSNPFDGFDADPDAPFRGLPLSQRVQFLALLADHPLASTALRSRLASRLTELGRPKPRRPSSRPVGLADDAPPPPAVTAPRPTVAGAGDAPPYRRLRGFAVDPSLAQQLDTAPVSTVTFRVPWEPLAPGPVGEYLEVIDVDPAARCVYRPVDLDDPRLLAQDGLPASDGLPQFHQQMVYAVASQTIAHFERALGRKSLWRPGPPWPGTHENSDAHYVPRLRIYPHAIRAANAYYSPARIALLFGYYPAAESAGDHLPGGMVFTCLSHDVVAHETTHALLDGMHRRFIRPTNPDVLAFHEAFADLVALFQHFTLPEVLRHQIGRTRGDLRSQQNMLGELAGEFGRTIGRGGALRSAIGSIVTVGSARRWKPAEPDPKAYQTTFEPHERGALLVAAVFSAFLSIYETRSADLLRLATGGTAVLPNGVIPPDLVNRLSDEAGKAAQQVLTMCVRALDYCPPVDLTFGDFLRALITADADLVPDDDLGYRVAFIEAFRQRGLFPHDVRTMSVDSLRWRRSDHDELTPSPQLLGGLQTLRDRLPLEVVTGTREQIFHRSRDVRRAMHGWLEDHFAGRGRGRKDDPDADFIGIDARRPFEVHSVRVAHRVGPDGDLLRQIIVQIHQDAADPDRRRGRRVGAAPIEGGSTIVADLDRLAIDYCIRKRAHSASRAAAQQAFARRMAGGSLYDTYFRSAVEREPVARLHREI